MSNHSYTKKNTQAKSAVFDYRTLRLLVGLIAFNLSILVCLISSIPLTSISASYYTEAQDVFVGLLFVVGAFLWAYNGHDVYQSCASKVAAISAILVAVFPTTCDSCSPSGSGHIHYLAAMMLFSILTYFCFGPFREKIKSRRGNKGKRSKIYLTCGWVMVGCLFVLVLKVFGFINIPNIIFWAESVALTAFGVAWTVAGKRWFFVDENEKLHFFKS